MVHGFELLRKVAEGSAAEAFLARAPGADHSVLVEVSRAEVLDDIELYGRFLDRAMGRRDFHHPHLVERQTAGCGPDGRVYVTTEAIAGETVADRLRDGKLFDPAQALRLMIPISAAVGYLHSRTVVHGNLCPSNVYLTGPSDQPVPKLLEMGLLLFRTNRSMKTPGSSRFVGEAYLSPERASGHRADVRSDVYGLGVLLFELLTGRPPYAARSLHQTAPIPVLPPDAAPLAELVARCLAKEPSHRFQSAKEVQLALEAVHLGRDALETLDIQVDLEPPIILGHTVNQRGARTGPKKLVIGSYEILKPLGEGGMGRVYLARHTKLDRLVAIKMLKAAYASDPLHLQRFVQEARAVNRVKHPNLVEIVDFIEDGPGRVCCVMEPLFGETVKDRAKRSPIKICGAVKIIRQACGALAAVHAAGVIHRDLKPDNLFLVEREGQSDFVKVLDFGIAQVLDDEQALLTTRTGEVVGTPAYMAPEQTIAGPIDGRADIYALGTVLYVLLQGRFPHCATQPEQLLAQKVLQKPRPMESVAASGEAIPRGLRLVVDRCVQRNPAARFQTMDELAQALLPYEQEVPIELTQRKLSPRSPRWKWWPGALALALALCGGAWLRLQGNAGPLPVVTRPAPVVAAPVVAPAPVVEPAAIIVLSEVTTRRSAPIDPAAQGVALAAVEGSARRAAATEAKPTRKKRAIRTK